MSLKRDMQEKEYREFEGLEKLFEQYDLNSLDMLKIHHRRKEKRELIRQAYRDVLAACGYNLSKVRRMIGIPRQTLYNHLVSLGIDFTELRNSSFDKR